MEIEVPCSSWNIDSGQGEGVEDSLVAAIHQIVQAYLR